MPVCTASPHMGPGCCSIKGSSVQYSRQSRAPNQFHTTVGVVTSTTMDRVVTRCTPEVGGALSTVRAQCNYLGV